VWNVSAHSLIGIAQILGFSISNEWKTFKYLGLPMCLKSLPGEYWQIILQKIREKMDSWGTRWLNLAGRVVLIKSVMSSLPLFQFSSLLAPKGAMKDMAQLICKFLWQGGKSNAKKFHLVNWNIVSSPKDSGGLGIRDPEVVNIAMGAKLLWRLITGRKEWWKSTIIKKYNLGARKRCLDSIPEGQPGTQIWKLFRASIPFFKENLSWIPGNGKLIRLWQDPISGSDLISRSEEIANLKRWMISEHKITLFDISSWNEDGSWKGWRLGDFPIHLQCQAHLLISFLKGAAPIHRDIQDSRGWGPVGYTVKEGYKILLANSRNLINSARWKNIWSSDALPKINIFIWTLAHGKILTGENLMKRGFHGPFTCALCQRTQESSQHLFWECTFSSKVWESVYRELIHQVRWPSNYSSCLGHWERFYQGYFHGKPIFKRLWKSLPKFVSWQIWLARNRFIFQTKKSQPQIVASKEISQMTEVMNTKKLSIEDLNNWNTSEKAWISKFNLHPSHSPYSLQRSCWQLHSPTFNFDHWILSQPGHTLCFDGASKGNPGEAGGGGSLRTRRKKNLEFLLESREGNQQ
jgi:hypothetical protein